MDFIHGNSPLFGNCRRRMGVDEGKCYFCQSMEDNPLHQFFVCKEVQDSAFDDLFNSIQFIKFCNTIIHEHILF